MKSKSKERKKEQQQFPTGTCFLFFAFLHLIANLRISVIIGDSGFNFFFSMN